jgi:hypothetical protein
MDLQYTALLLLVICVSLLQGKTLHDEYFKFSVLLCILKWLSIVEKGDTLLAVGRGTVGKKHKTTMGMHVKSLREGKWGEIWWKFVAYLWKSEQKFSEIITGWSLSWLETRRTPCVVSSNGCKLQNLQEILMMTPTQASKRFCHRQKTKCGKSWILYVVSH